MFFLTSNTMPAAATQTDYIWMYFDDAHTSDNTKDSLYDYISSIYTFEDHIKHDRMANVRVSYVLVLHKFWPSDAHSTYIWLL